MSQTNQNLRQAGLKVTLPRLKILELLERSHNDHLSAEDVYKTMMEQNEDVSLPTVYRVLKQFEDAGIVVSHNFGSQGSTVYEIKTEENHNHFICVRCNEVTEFTSKVIDEEQQKIIDDLGFTLTDHALVLHGLCAKPECNK